MLALSIPLSSVSAASAGDNDPSADGAEGMSYVIAGFNSDNIIYDLGGNSISGHPYCLDFKQKTPLIRYTDDGKIDEIKSPLFKKVLLSELDSYEKRVFKGYSANQQETYYEPYTRNLTPKVKSRLMKIMMNTSDVKAKASSIKLTDEELSSIAAKVDEFDKDTLLDRWDIISNSSATVQQLIWTVVHDDSEWADYVKDDNSATHHEDLYHYTEGYYQYMPEDPLTDRLSLWNTFYKKMINYIDNEITTDYLAEGYDAWVYITYKDRDIDTQNIISEPFYKFKEVKIRKVDENNVPLAGAFLGVYDQKNNSVPGAVWTSDTEPFSFYISEPGTYTIRENYAPAGYLPMDELTLRVEQNGSIYLNDVLQNGVIDVVNKDKTELHIRKTDIITHNELAGATLAIYRADDLEENGSLKDGAAAIDKWVSTTQDHIIRGVLEIDTEYVLRETIAPAGYARMLTDTKFSIVGSGENKGKVAIKDSENSTQYSDILLIEDRPYKPAELNVTVSKKLTGWERPSEKEFTFTIERADGFDEAPLPANNTVTITGEGEAVFPEPIIFTKLGYYVYKITETAGGEKGYTYDPTVYYLVVTTGSSGDILEDGRVQLLTETHITLDGVNELQKIEFTNDYTPVNAVLEIPVAVKRIEGCVPAESDKTFSFEIKTDDNAAPMPENPQVSVNGSGNATSFGRFIFTKTGTYTYSISECALDSSYTGYTRDESVYTLTVTVTNNDGALEAAYDITKNGEPANELIFTNKYQPAPVAVSVPGVVKKLNGPVPEGQAKTFTFGIRPAAGSAGAPLPAQTAVTVTGSGNANFGSITFDKAGSFVYEIFEADLTGGHEGYTKDSAVYTFTVNIVDNGGVLAAESTSLTKDGATAANAEFTNKYRVTSVKADFNITKKVNYDTCSEDFKFRLYNFDTDESEYITIKGSGTGSFSSVVYTGTGVHTYSINEIAGTTRGMTYDNRVYRITDTVVDENSQLKVIRTITIGDTEYDSVTFENFSQVTRSGRSTSTGSTEGGNTDGGNTDGGNTDGGNTDGGNTDGGNTDGGNTDGGNTDGGNTDGGNTDGGNTGGGNTDGGNTGGGNTGGGNTGGGSTGGGNTDGGNSDGGNTDGGNTDGGNTDGGNTGGGETSGEGTPEAGGGSDSGINPATGTAGIIGINAIVICAAAILVKKRNK